MTVPTLRSISGFFEKANCTLVAHAADGKNDFGSSIRFCTGEIYNSQRGARGRGIALNIVSRGIAGTDPRRCPIHLAHVPRNNKNGFARTTSEFSRPGSPPVAPLHDYATRCYVIQMDPKERNKESLPTCKSAPILSRSTPIAHVYLIHVRVRSHLFLFFLASVARYLHKADDTAYARNDGSDGEDRHYLNTRQLWTRIYVSCERRIAAS